MAFYQGNYLTAGDRWEFPVTLEKPAGTLFDVPLTATVKAAIVSLSEVKISEDYTIDSSDPGNDWPNGVVVPVFVGSESSKVTGTDRYVTCEIQITEQGGAQHTFFVDNIPVRQGKVS